MIARPLLSQYFCHFPIQLLLCLFFESEMQRWLLAMSSSMANFHLFPQYDPELQKNGTGPDNDLLSPQILKVEPV